ncbi:MAG: Ig-like domain-containing protein [Chloroflexi bacterium]|nr:Ig-like domain-containing protein [Chloroflexota bacterium]
MSRNYQHRLMLCILLTATALAGCSPQSGGPSVWLDQPLDGRTFPMGPVTILAHAADVDGLQSIEFRVDGAPVGEVAVDAERFGEAGIEWLPPGPGTYSLEVVALDAAGGRGSSARVTIIVADASLLALTTPTPTPWTPVKVTGVTCGPGVTVKVDFEVTSPSGVVSVEVFSTYTATDESKLTFTAPYPLTVKDTLWLDEGEPDSVNRPHLVGVKAILLGQSMPVFGYE